MRRSQSGSPAPSLPIAGRHPSSAPGRSRPRVLRQKPATTRRRLSNRPLSVLARPDIQAPESPLAVLSPDRSPPAWDAVFANATESCLPRWRQVWVVLLHAAGYG